jgi:lipase
MSSRGSDKSGPAAAGSIETVNLRTSDTTALHVERFGPDGPPQILAIHGLTGHGRRWKTLAEQHLGEYAVAAPDLLGHGRSRWSAPWTLDANVAALAALVTGGPVVVVGHSFGGAVALNLAAARPDLVSALVLLDPAVGLDGEWMREIADDMLASPDYTDAEEARGEKASGSWAEVDPAELDREMAEHLVELPSGRVGWRISIPATLSYWSELARPAVVPRDGTPTTLVRAMRTDPAYVTDELITALDAGLGSDFRLLQWDCDHMVAQARPAETAAIIRERLP